MLPDVASYANSTADVGEPTVTAGWLGNGKSMPTNTAVGSTCLILGIASAVGCNAVDPGDKVSLASRNCITGPAI